MLSCCVKQRKMMECVPGSEVVVKLKNGRDMMKCICQECGNTKTKFIKKQDYFIIKKDFICNNIYGSFNYCYK